MHQHRTQTPAPRCQTAGQPWATSTAVRFFPLEPTRVHPPPPPRTRPRAFRARLELAAALQRRRLLRGRRSAVMSALGRDCSRRGPNAESLAWAVWLAGGVCCTFTSIMGIIILVRLPARQAPRFAWRADSGRCTRAAGSRLPRSCASRSRRRRAPWGSRNARSCPTRHEPPRSRALLTTVGSFVFL